MKGMTYVGCVFSIAVFAATAVASDPAAPAPSNSNPEPYVPGLGEFMTSGVQPHHIKLWFAATKRGWKLAAYEADELQETFNDIMTYQAEWHNLPITRFVQATVMSPLKGISVAIGAENLAQFRIAYTALNSACNSCHVAAEHDFVKIAVPVSNPFADQRFGQR
jgi:hypothetical protein